MKSTGTTLCKPHHSSYISCSTPDTETGIINISMWALTGIYKLIFPKNIMECQPGSPALDTVVILGSLLGQCKLGLT